MVKQGSCWRSFFFFEASVPGGGFLRELFPTTFHPSFEHAFFPQKRLSRFSHKPVTDPRDRLVSSPEFASPLPVSVPP